MSRKNRRLTTMLILVVALLGLGSGYYALSKANREKEAAKEGEGDQSVELYQINKDEVAGIHYKNEASELSLVKEGDKWVREDQKDVPMNQDYVDGMLKELETVTAKNSWKPETQDLSPYGLDQPLLSFEVTMADGERYEFKMGAEVPTDNGHYSLVGGDTDTIYVLPILLFNKFKYSATEMIVIEDQFEVNVSNITRFALERKGEEPIEVKSVKDEAGWEQNYYEWALSKPYPTRVMADSINIKEFFGGFSSLKFDECVEYKATDLDRYGLDEPKATMVMEYYDVVGSSQGEDAESAASPLPSAAQDEEEKEEVREDKSYTLLVGEQKDEDSYYVKLAGKDQVYLLASTVVEPVLGVDVFQISDQCVFLGLVTDMSGYEFTVGGKTHTVTRTEERKPREDAEDSQVKEDIVQHYTVDGHAVEDANTFVNIFSATYLLEVTGLADDSVKPEDDAPVLTLNYHMLTGEDVVLKFLPYDGSNFYRVDKNGVDYFLTDKRKVDDIVKRYTEYVDSLK